MLDLRSDTVTRPTPGMRQAIANAEVGDDMFGEDPTVRRLEERMAELFGTEAAVYACSGTQSNQMGLRAHCLIGDEILIEEFSHVANYEAGAPAALSGITCRTIRGQGGLLDVSDLNGKVRPNDQHYCITRLVSLENTSNHGGGRVWPLAQMARVSQWAHQQGVKVHVDGARIFNAAIAGNYTVKEFTAYADSISICFSKGLGCPMGSMLVGSNELIHKARRARKQFGGALRQAGMMAAAAIYALDHHVERLRDDHAHARAFAEAIAESPRVKLDLSAVESNLVFYEIDPAWGTAAQFSARLKELGVRMNSMGPQRLRACTHLDLTRDDVLQAAKIICAALKTLVSQAEATNVSAY